MALFRVLSVLPPPEAGDKPLQGLLGMFAAAFRPRPQTSFIITLLLFVTVCPSVSAQTATHVPPDTAAARGWYAGAEGGVPFAVSTFSSFADGRTYAGWLAGVFAGYAFSPVVSLEAQAGWSRPALGARECCTESGYWLGSDGRRYHAPVSGLPGWDYSSLKSRVTVQSYGLQLNLNVLPWLGAPPQNRWGLEVSPRLAAVGTKARLYDTSTGRQVKGLPTRWHLGAGFRLQGSYAVADRLRIGLYTGMTFLTGKGMDGIPRHAHSSNYLWESGLRLSFSFGKAKRRAAEPARTVPVTPIQPAAKPEPEPEKPAPVVEEQPKPVAEQPKPVAEKAEAGPEKTVFPVIFFNFNSTAVRRSERGKAGEIARIMADDPEMRVRLTGWCDTKGATEVNLRVSLRRAEAVKRLLVSLGVDGSRITTDGKGSDYEQQDAAKARRVVTVIIGEEGL